MQKGPAKSGQNESRAHTHANISTVAAATTTTTRQTDVREIIAHAKERARVCARTLNKGSAGLACASTRTLRARSLRKLGRRQIRCDAQMNWCVAGASARLLQPQKRRAQPPLAWPGSHRFSVLLLLRS